MKSLKRLLLFGISLMLTSIAYANLSDDLDKNVVPADLEEREHEEMNFSDPIDDNKVPARLEEREEEEEAEYDFSQTDDPEKSYDYHDEELDEQP